MSKAELKLIPGKLYKLTNHSVCWPIFDRALSIKDAIEFPAGAHFMYLSETDLAGLNWKVLLGPDGKQYYFNATAYTMVRIRK